jgi:hypothetical protein
MVVTNHQEDENNIEGVQDNFFLKSFSDNLDF